MVPIRPKSDNGYKRAVAPIRDDPFGRVRRHARIVRRPSTTIMVKQISSAEEFAAIKAAGKPVRLHADIRARMRTTTAMI